MYSEFSLNIVVDLNMHTENQLLFNISLSPRVMESSVGYNLPFPFLSIHNPMPVPMH